MVMDKPTMATCIFSAAHYRWDHEELTKEMTVAPAPANATM